MVALQFPVSTTYLPISANKLDHATAGRLPDDLTMQLVVDSMLALAAELGLEVVAEGLETAEHPVEELTQNLSVDVKAVNTHWICVPTLRSVGYS
jgi:EAL domain-containing protein (putative c-di-GMP-specific phosphodiesterase class I)